MVQIKRFSTAYLQFESFSTAFCNSSDILVFRNSICEKITEKFIHTPTNTREIIRYTKGAKTGRF